MLLADASYSRTSGWRSPRSRGRSCSASWQMLCAQPVAFRARRCRALLPLGDGAHGTALRVVFPTLIAMGFGYAVCVSALDRPLRGERLAWRASSSCSSGALMSLLAVAAGNSSVLYTFYPPLTGSPFYYLGIVLAVVGSWFWVGLMV